MSKSLHQIDQRKGAKKTMPHPDKPMEKKDMPMDEKEFSKTMERLMKGKRK